VLSAEKEADDRNKVFTGPRFAMVYISASPYRSNRRNAMRHRLLSCIKGDRLETACAIDLPRSSPYHGMQVDKMKIKEQTRRTDETGDGELDGWNPGNPSVLDLVSFCLSVSQTTPRNAHQSGGTAMRSG
jgi:hypothetical protein